MHSHAHRSVTCHSTPHVNLYASPEKTVITYGIVRQVTDLSLPPETKTRHIFGSLQTPEGGSLGSFRALGVPLPESVENRECVEIIPEVMIIP